MGLDCAAWANEKNLISANDGPGSKAAEAEKSKQAIPDGKAKYIPPAKATDAGPDCDLAWLRNPEDKAKFEAQSYAKLMPALQERYGKRKDMDILEVGPLRTTSVAHALAGSTKLYQGLDISKNAAKVQQEFLDKEGLTRAKAIVGDLYNLPLADGSQDLIFASRTTPLGSIHATRESLTRAYSEIARVLKPGGEFVLYPEPRKEIRAFDPSGEILREVKRISIPPNPGSKDESWMIIFSKRQ
jgi:SAM-dependent methyltransferase